MPSNPFSLIILFSNPFNASNLGGGWGWAVVGAAEEGKPGLWCSAGTGRTWLLDARAPLCFPPMASQTGGQLTGQHGRGEFPSGEDGVGGSEAGAGQTAESLILQMLTDFGLTSRSPLSTTAFLLPQKTFHSQVCATTLFRRSLICLQLHAIFPVEPARTFDLRSLSPCDLERNTPSEEV